jgi:predicted Ser/Thr protein kinase
MSRDSEDRPDGACAKCGAALASPGGPCPDCTTVAADETLLTASVPDADEELELIRSALDADYEIIEELGRGGMAVVYRARERALERDVAIKVLPLARTFDPEFVERFQREARLSASLEHPHIVPIYRVDQSGRLNFFVMKYLRGLSLADMLKEQPRMESKEVEKILLEVGDALDSAHSQGVIHRDVKPDNIMKDQTGRYVVMDFGVAKSIGGEQLTQTGGSIGTPKYMSPEQGRGGELDGRSDFYSLGVVAYHCLVGRAPFEGDDALSILYSHLHDPVPEPSLDSDDDRRVYSVIRRLLAKSPDDRAQSGEDIRADLSQAVSSTGTAVGGRGAAAPDSSPQVGPASPHGVVRWLQTRTRRFWITAGAGAFLGFALFGRDGASAQCRAAMSDASEGDRALLVEPLGTVSQGAEIEVSYVACGLPANERFEARVTIRPADGGGVVGGVSRFLGGGEDPVRVSWDDRADGFATSRNRTITPGELEAGSYRVTLRIEDSDGRDTEASHDFTVVSR